MNREREKFIKISPRKQLAMLGGASALLLMGAGAACGGDKTPESPLGGTTLNTKEATVNLPPSALNEIAEKVEKAAAKGGETGGEKGAFEGAKAGVAEGLKALPTVTATATRTPEPTATPRPTETPVPTSTPEPSESKPPRTTSRPLLVNQWTMVREGEIVAGDIDTGGVRHDNNRLTGMVTGPLEQDTWVIAPWGGTVSRLNDLNDDPIAIRNQIAKEMLRNGCGTGVGCPEGVVVTDGIRVINVIRPES